MNKDHVGIVLVAVAVLVLSAGALDGRVNQGRRRSPGGWLVHNFVTGSPLIPGPTLRGTGSPARALARIGVVAGAAGGWLLATVAGPAAVAAAAGAVGVVALVVGRLLERAQRWLVREGVWADVAWWWLVRNFVSGDPVRPGPALRDTTGGELLAERAKVAVPRLVALGAGGGAVYELVGVVVAGGAPGPVWLAFVIGLAAPALAAVLVGLGLRSAVERAHFQRWVLPLHLAVHDLLGYPLDFEPRRYLHVPRGKAAEGDGVVIEAQPTFSFEDKTCDRVAALTIRKLALADVTTHWEGKAHHAYLQVRPRQHAPTTALFAEIQVRALIEKAKASAPVIGLTIGNKPVAFDLDSETPHVLLSMGTGAGKSALLRSMTAQLMHHGAHVVVIDFKRHSQQWLRGLPGVTYVRDPEDIHDMFVWLATEGDRRNRAWDNVPLGAEGPRFPRLVVVCEELNGTFSKLRRYWSSIRSSSQPQLSPAVEGFQDLLFMGRAVQIHVLAVTQMATAKDLGGPEARENFALRVLARYTQNAWRMLVPEIAYRPPSIIAGRLVVCRAGTA